MNTLHHGNKVVQVDAQSRVTPNVLDAQYRSRNQEQLKRTQHGVDRLKIETAHDRRNRWNITEFSCFNFERSLGYENAIRIYPQLFINAIVKTSKGCLAYFNPNPNKFFLHFTTMDERWLHNKPQS